VALAAALMGFVGCGGGSTSIDGPMGGSSPEQAVEVFLTAAQEGTRSLRAGNMSEADKAYERMAAVFGTEAGSIRRSHPAGEVRDRMIVLAGCLRPDQFRLSGSPDPQAWSKKRTSVTVELKRDGQTVVLPFKLVLGRGERWFIEQIDLTASSFSC
jgi:hypothetical protein